MKLESWSCITTNNISKETLALSKINVIFYVFPKNKEEAKNGIGEEGRRVQD